MTERKFVENLEGLFLSEGFLAQREVGVGYGVADLVLIRKQKVNFKNCNKRIGYGQSRPLLGDHYFNVLKHLPDFELDKSVNTDYLAKKSKLSKSFLKYSILSSLQKNKYIKKTKNDYYVKINGWLPIAKEIIAIEAKMKDWKRGFVQAGRYKLFADKVYLAVPKEVEHLVNKDLLAKHKVGLIILNTETNTKKIALPAPRVRPLNIAKKNFAIEYFWNKKTLKQLALV